MVALADALGWAALCAVTTTAVAGMVLGAVYKPPAEIVPAADVPPKFPLTSQFTELLLAPETVAENCCALPSCRLVLVGVIETETGLADDEIETVALADTDG